MNVKRIESRVKINYQNIVEKIVDDKSISSSHVVFWLIKELTVLQKYILELLINRLNQQIKIKELLND